MLRPSARQRWRPRCPPRRQRPRGGRTRGTRTAEGSPTSMSAWISAVARVDARDLPAIVEREPERTIGCGRVLRRRPAECCTCCRPAETLNLSEVRDCPGRQRLADGSSVPWQHTSPSPTICSISRLPPAGRRHFEGCRHAHPRAVDEPLAQRENVTLDTGPGELRGTEHLVGAARVAVLELPARFALSHAAIELDPDRKAAARIHQLPLPGPRKRDVGARRRGRRRPSSLIDACGDCPGRRPRRPRPARPW